MVATFNAFKSTLGYDKRVSEALRQIDNSEGGALSEKPQKAAMRFAYASGSKPLSGYTIKRGVGTGGFGEVYFAVSDAGKEVALKKVQRHLDIELRGVSHCLNLKHPNLISLYDVRYDDDGQAWVVMEYVGGANMRQALDLAPHGFSLEETLRWFAGLAAGVAHLHDAGIVHRDLKPGNVFDDDGIVKIGDYGLSKYISCSQRGGHTESIGTFHYMAPEVGRGNYGREIDIYAMGIILFEMLTGTVPFDGESSQEIVMKHLTDNPDLSRVAEPYRGVIWQAMQKNPGARQHSVAQMVRPLGIEIDSHGIARVQTFASPATVAGVMAGGLHRSESIDTTDGIQFVGSPVAARPGNSRVDSPAAEGVRFGEVRYHDPSPVPLAGSVPAADQRGVVQGGLVQGGGKGYGANRLASESGLEGNLNGLRRWWSSLDATPGTQAVILVVGCFILLLNPWLMMLGVVLGLFYAIYFFIRSLFGGGAINDFSGATTSQGVAGMGVRNGFGVANAQPVLATWVPRAVPRPMTVKQWVAQRRPELASQNRTIKAADFFGSTMVATIASCFLAVIGVAGLYLAGGIDERFATEIAVGSAIGLVGAILLLGFGKVWEGESAPAFSRRFVLLGCGAAAGLFGYLVSDYLYLGSEGLEFFAADTLLSGGAMSDWGARESTLWMGHYAIVFVLLRWWLNTDPLRVRRLSLWRIAVALVAESLVQMFVGVAQPVGFVSVFVMAVATQVAASWENPKARLREVNQSLRSA